MTTITSSTKSASTTTAINGSVFVVHAAPASQQANPDPPVTERAARVHHADLRRVFEAGGPSPGRKPGGSSGEGSPPIGGRSRPGGPDRDLAPVTSTSARSPPVPARPPHRHAQLAATTGARSLGYRRNPGESARPPRCLSAGLLRPAILPRPRPGTGQHS